MKSIIDSLPDQICEMVNSISLPALPRKRYHKVLICGMGGSGISGDIAKALYPKIEITTNKDYEITQQIDKHTLGIFISYSGNTEETLTNYAYCARKGIDRVIITSNGTLFRKKTIAKIQVPSGLPPRGALGYLFAPIPFILHTAGMLKNSPGTDLLTLARFLKREQKRLMRKAGSIASRILNRLCILYVDSQCMWPAARRWQCQLNENTKVLAHINIIPEMNHNEIVGLGSPHSLRNHTTVILLNDPKAHPRNILRGELLNRVVGKNMPSLITVKPDGRNSLQHVFWTILLGDYVSLYCAKRSGVDPLPVKRIDILKKLLAGR